MNSTFQGSKRFINRINGSVTFKLQVCLQGDYDRTLLNDMGGILMIIHYRYL